MAKSNECKKKEINQMNTFRLRRSILLPLIAAAVMIMGITASFGQTYVPRSYVFENTSGSPRTLRFSYNMAVGEGALVTLTIAPHQKWAINCTVQGLRIIVYLNGGLYVNNQIPVLGTDPSCTPAGTILIK